MSRMSIDRRGTKRKADVLDEKVVEPPALVGGKRFVYVPVPALQPDDFEYDEADKKQITGIANEKFRAHYAHVPATYKDFQTKKKEIDDWGGKGPKSLVKRMGMQPGGAHDRLIYHNGTDRVLRDAGVRADDILYIHCHGNSDVVGFRPFGLAPADLARLIQFDRLDPEHVVVKLWTCHSGEQAGPDRDRPSYAQRLSTELFRCGYTKSMVYGYTGPVCPYAISELKVGRRIVKSVRVHGDGLTRASEARRVFHNGAEYKNISSKTPGLFGAKTAV